MRHISKKSREKTNLQIQDSVDDEPYEIPIESYLAELARKASHK